MIDLFFRTGNGGGEFGVRLNWWAADISITRWWMHPFAKELRDATMLEF